MSKGKKIYIFEDLIVENIDSSSYEFSDLEAEVFDDGLVAYSGCATGGMYCGGGGTIP